MVSSLHIKEKPSLFIQPGVGPPEVRSYSQNANQLIAVTGAARETNLVQKEEFKSPSQYIRGAFAFASAAASAVYDKPIEEDRKIEEDFKVLTNKVLSKREEVQRSQPKPLSIAQESDNEQDSWSQQSKRVDVDRKKMSFKDIVHLKSLKTHKLTIQDGGQSRKHIFNDSLLPDEGRKSRPLIRVRSSEAIIHHKYYIDREDFVQENKMMALFQNMGADAASEKNKHEKELPEKEKSASQNKSDSVGMISVHQKSFSSSSRSEKSQIQSSSSDSVEEDADRPV